MPRKARIDTPGALYYIIFRGIERRKGRLGTSIELLVYNERYI